ncbi:bestrophin family ion channel [Winogradskyella maritima]|uniref:Bestrophin family protein n=1 Tax=Winogradskyella maritima TaxID=1517766 RepID=A0ABV8AIM7_9FLAO|nr:bestrophin family ion channel [Winogradskyella maritima]
MLTKKRYSVKDMVLWTRKETFFYLFYAGVITVLYKVFGFTFLNVPWTPVALIGTAVAFMIGFQNNSAYGRIWEARKIWGAIVNTSRTWGMKVQDMVSNAHAPNPVSESVIKEEKRILVYRHVAWMTALRYAMRTRKSWETQHTSQTNREWRDMIHIPEEVSSLDDNLKLYLSDEERHYVMSKPNKQTALLYLQSAHIRKLKDVGLIWEFAFLELENVLEELFTHQGKSERIKNFPYPRQYASLSLYLTRVFALLLPFGLIPEFADIGQSMTDSFFLIGKYFIWVAVPFCAVVSWAFHTMERMARVGENPFEGTSNDVPISTISRGIEIDMRQMLDEDESIIPSQFPEEKHVQM